VAAALAGEREQRPKPVLEGASTVSAWKLKRR